MFFVCGLLDAVWGAGSQGPGACSWVPGGGGEQAGQVMLALASNEPVSLHTWLLKCLQPRGARLQAVCK